MSESIEWNIIESYLHNNKLSNIQIDSYNHCVFHTLPDIINDYLIIVKLPHQRHLKISFHNMFVDKAHVYDENRHKKYILPHEARTRDLSYETIIYCDVHVELIHTVTKQVLESDVYPRHQLFQIPVMLRSALCNLKKYQIENECMYDFGGYFVLRGKERVLIAQERINYNQIYVYKTPNSKYLYSAEIRSVKEDADYSVLMQAKISADKEIVFQIPYISIPVPIALLFLAIGISYDDMVNKYLDIPEIKDFLFYQVEIYEYVTHEEALEFISQYTSNKVEENEQQNYTFNILTKEIFPHLGLFTKVEDYAYYMSLMLKKLCFTFLEIRPEDDRDHISNKRVENTGDLLSNLIKALFKKFCKKVEQQIEKRGDYSNLPSIFQKHNFTKKLYSCFSTGSWGVPKSNYIRQGVSQIMNRLNYLGFQSQLRKLVIPLGRESKNMQVRQLHCTSYGFTCGVECFDPDTPILLWDGTIKLAKDIEKGDYLIDDNGLPTRVKSTCAGVTDMYQVKQYKKGFMDYTVTSNHILTLKIKKHKEILRNNPRNKYVLKWFDKDKLKYKSKEFTDLEQAKKMRDTIGDNILDITIKDYLELPKNTRRELYGFKLPKEKLNPLIKITPCDSILQSEIEVTKKGPGQFVGWQLEGNGRFLLSDLTVVHNTPEGSMAGIVKNFATLVEITENIETVIVQDILFDNFSFSKEIEFDKYKILLNGILLGSLEEENLKEFVQKFKELRRLGFIHYYVSISYNTIDREIYIQSDKGRMIRAVLISRNNLPQELENLLKNVEMKDVWKTLLDNGFIEFIDGYETESSNICMYVKDCDDTYDYCEIHPAMMLGFSANLTPFPEHSQAPRNIYQCAMGKQGISLFATSFNHRFDTMSHVLNYPQKRIVNTKMANFCHAEDLPSGINCVVAVACYTGFNMEDSIILNKGAVDRGLFRSVGYKTLTTSEVKRGTHDNEVIVIEKEKQIHNFDYSKLDRDGIVCVNSYVSENVVLVSKIQYKDNEPIKDCSLVCKHNEYGIVDKVCVTVNALGYKHVKIKIRNQRIPEVGDKCASIEAQKGTIGMIYSQEDMPFNSDGICPDVIINAHALPSQSGSRNLVTSF